MNKEYRYNQVSHRYYGKTVWDRSLLDESFDKLCKQIYEIKYANPLEGKELEDYL